MHSEFKPEANDPRSLFFVKESSYSYKVTYKNINKRKCSIVYATPHEVILNLYIFSNDDTVTYVSNEKCEEAFTITIERFKLNMTETVLDSTQDNLESLYLRLILTNWHSKAIVDRGRLRHFDQLLRTYLLTLKGGYDSFLSYEDKKVVMRFKGRRDSALHLIATIFDWNQKGDVQVNHINLPKTIPNQELIYECLKLEVDKNNLRMYSYRPVPEDNILPTKIDWEIIRIINQLIK